MSSISFNTPSRDAMLHGSERHYLGHLSQSVATGFFLRSSSRERIAALLNPQHYLVGMTDAPGWLQQLETALAVSGFGMGDLFVWRGRPLGTDTILTNTAMVVGNEVIQLATRIHNQCEIHGYVEGPNRVWLADLMQRGLDAGLFRRSLQGDSQGWEQVIDLLRERDDEPVVMAYSVTNSFPNRFVTTWTPADDSDDAADAWYELPGEDQWRMSMDALRASTGLLEIKPDHFHGSYHFGHGLSAIDLFAPDYAERLDAAMRVS
jgi:hypothetical protein